MHVRTAAVNFIVNLYCFCLIYKLYATVFSSINKDYQYFYHFVQNKRRVLTNKSAH